MSRIRWSNNNGFVGKVHMFRIISGAGIDTGRGIKSRYSVGPVFPEQWLKGDYRKTTALGGDPESLKPVAEAMLNELIERLGVTFKEETS
jgi:hypothetical protein